MADPEYIAISKAKRQVEGANPEGAIKTLEDYLFTDPHNTKVRLQLAQIIIYHTDRLQYGLMQLDAILDLEPDNVDALIALVTVLSRDKKNTKEVDEKFQKLLEVRPDAEVYAMYAMFLKMQKTDFKGSKEYFVKAINMDPNNIPYRQNYAMLLLNDLKDYVAAKAELEYLMQLKPNDPNVKKNYDRLMKEKFDKDGNVKKSRFAFLKR